ncbi:MAG: deoxyguanosinetriphosphate triphosphohydrolase [Firmicutes bacterium]|nr:deoxyguanosinetriphosphate triphosphohydrolase [Bacillota bacterium]
MVEDLGHVGGPRLREAAEELEDRHLDPRACRSRLSRGRERPEEECPIRTCFQRDRDRIVHSKAFRRLKGKTQVFLSPRGDHYRTRLTHSLEVSQIARTIARALRLNEDLVEAVALGHDLGHTPFGHAGEAALAEVMEDGFRHNEQSLRVVTVLEGDGAGLNLTWEVRDGILNHVPDRRPATLEGQVVQLADRIAYINHDIDDAVRAGVLRPEDLPPAVAQVLGERGSQRIGTMVTNVVETMRAEGHVALSGAVGEVTEALHDFMFERVYLREAARAEHLRVRRMLADLYRFYVDNPDVLLREFPRAVALTGGLAAPGETTGPGRGARTEEGDEGRLRRVVADYVAGMTDRFAIDRYTDHFIPHTWEE